MAIHFENLLLQTDLTTTAEDINNGVRYEPRLSRERRRIRKERLTRKCDPSPEDSFENLVDGEGHFCFSADGDWFQGNMISQRDCIYQVTGKRTEDSEEDANLMSSSLNSNSSGEGSSYDSRDDENCRLYNLNVIDFETGFNYHLDRVLVRRGKRHCCIMTHTSQLTFESRHYFFGITADIFLHSQFGPSYIGRGLRVFTGPLRFTFKDPVWKAYQQNQLLSV